jgi:diguanylate cyclase (GGDEF)-like protein/PAS domain S-box-containing protein
VNRRTLRVLLPVSFLIIAVGIAATVFVQQYLAQQYRSREMRELRISAARVRIRLEEIISTDLSAIHAMASYIAVHPDLDHTRFSAFARQIIGRSATLRNLVASKGLVISFVHPLDGNESVLGVDYRDVPSQLPLVMEARDTGRLVVAGPVETIQGGRGIIGRAPVYVAVNGRDGDFWGIVSSVISFEGLIGQLRPISESSNVAFALRGVDGTGESGDVFYGDPCLFDDGNTVIQEVMLPTGSWLLAVAPETLFPQRHPHWFLVNATALFSVAFLLVLTASKVRSDTRLRESEGRLERYVGIVDNNVAIIQTDGDGVLTAVSTALCNLSGYTADDLIGRSVDDLVDPNTPGISFADIRDEVEGGSSWHGELKLQNSSGKTLWFDTDVSILYDESGTESGFLAVNQDITNRKELEILSITDRLTGLFNRQKTDFSLEEQRERYARYDETYSVIIFDIDHFKWINDANGHLAGDRVLKTIAEVITDHIRRTDIAGRWGGEEFLILCPHTNQEGATIVAEGLRKAIEGYDFGLADNVTASFGVVGVDSPVINQPAESPDFTEAILKADDDALYRAKMTGRNAVITVGQSQS